MFYVHEELEKSKADPIVFANRMFEELLYKSTNRTKPPPEAKRKIFYSPPYYDALGMGDIMTIGEPFYAPDGTIFGAVGLDTAQLTRGIGTRVEYSLLSQLKNSKLWSKIEFWSRIEFWPNIKFW